MLSYRPVPVAVASRGVDGSQGLYVRQGAICAPKRWLFASRLKLFAPTGRLCGLSPGVIEGDERVCGLSDSAPADSRNAQFALLQPLIAREEKRFRLGVLA